MAYCKIIQTVCYIVDKKRDKILLGRKKPRPDKEGLGIGKLNGHGGNFEPAKDQSIDFASLREVGEETGLALFDMKKIGLAVIRNEALGKTIELHVFMATNYSGRLKKESEEMINSWYPIKSLDGIYNEMWPSDRIILPYTLRNKKFIGYFHYNQDGELASYWMHEVEYL